MLFFWSLAFSLGVLCVIGRLRNSLAVPWVKNLMLSVQWLRSLLETWVRCPVPWVKDVALPQFWHRSQLRLGFDPWAENFYMPWVWLKKEKKAGRFVLCDISRTYFSSLSLVFQHHFLSDRCFASWIEWVCVASRFRVDSWKGDPAWWLKRAWGNTREGLAWQTMRNRKQHGEAGPSLGTGNYLTAAKTFR